MPQVELSPEEAARILEENVQLRKRVDEELYPFYQMIHNIDFCRECKEKVFGPTPEAEPSRHRTPRRRRNSAPVHA